MTENVNAIGTSDAARIEKLETQLAEAQERLTEVSAELNIKFGNKRNVVVGGPALGQRFPVSLYAPSWIVLLANKERILKFIEENSDQLSWDR